MKYINKYVRVFNWWSQCTVCPLLDLHRISNMTLYKNKQKYIIWHLNWDIHLNTLPYSERNKIMAFVDWAVGWGVGVVGVDGQILHCLQPVDLWIILFHFYVQYKAVKSWYNLSRADLLALQLHRISIQSVSNFFCAIWGIQITF